VNGAVGRFHHEAQVDDPDQAMGAQFVEFVQDLPLELVDAVEGHRDHLDWSALHRSTSNAGHGWVGNCL
jgi:hypothetical protein